MHKSIIAEYRELCYQPPAEPVCEIIDFHMHVNGTAEDEKYMRIAREYGIVRAGAMLHWTTSQRLTAEHQGFFFPIEWLRLPEKNSAKSWIREEVQRIEQEKSEGLTALKLRTTCKEGRPEIWIDHPYMLEVLQEVAAMGLFVYIHIAEPSSWWPKFFDPDVVGEKRDYLRPVENILRSCPQLQVVGAHLGGYPEELDFLAELLERYPNYSLDLSATKWIVRELGRDVVKSRAFIQRFQDRLYFGSDMVTFLSDGEEDYYRSRLMVLRHLFESPEVVPSMIIDPDAVAPDYPSGPEVRGLNLDADVLRKIYRDNALRLLEN